MLHCVFCFLRSNATVSRSKNGFTLLELLIFLGIFSFTIIGIISVFLAVSRVGVRQAGALEVSRQSQFLLQTIQYYVEKSALVEMDENISSQNLRLRMGRDADDPIYIYAQNGAMYLKQGQNPAQSLTSPRVNVTGVSFTRRTNPPGRDSVDISFGVEYVSGNIQHRASNNLKTTIARVSAASFDSSVVASTSNVYNLGTSAGNWRSVNSTIYFSGANVGIGALTPTAKLQINQGDVYVDTNGYGLVLKNSQGECWRLTVNNSGNVVTTEITCP